MGKDGKGKRGQWQTLKEVEGIGGEGRKEVERRPKKVKRYERAEEEG